MCTVLLPPGGYPIVVKYITMLVKSRKFDPGRTIMIGFQRWTKTLIAPDLKIIAKYKQQ
jgi:hypothetical protein